MSQTIPQEQTSKVHELAELVKKLCLALTNVEMFSSDHPISRESVTKAFEWLSGIFKDRREPVVISASGKQIILEGIPLEDKNPLVSKLTSKLDEIHVNNLFFEPELTAEEFQRLFGIFGKGARYINEHGGFARLLADSGITHVRIRELSYVMLTEDEKVVSKDAKVVMDSGGKVDADSEIVKYTVGEILKRADGQRWLMNEMKNNPKKVADLITEGINLAASRTGTGGDDNDGTMATLMNSIKLIGLRMAEEHPDEGREGGEDLGKALITLENEIRMRTNQMTSSKVAAGFINEILSVVGSYSDRARARQISDEFLKGEKSLEKTEKLLKQLTPASESPDRMLSRLRDLLVKKGMTEADLGKLVNSAAAKKEAKPRAPKKPRKPRDKIVLDGVAKRLRELNLEEPKLQEMAGSIGCFVEERAKERAGEFRMEAERLHEEVTRRESLLEKLPWGIVLWDDEGKAVFVNQAARKVLNADEGLELSVELRGALADLKFSLSGTDNLPGFSGLTEPEKGLILSVSQVLEDEDGKVWGAILSAGGNGHAPHQE